MSSIATTRRTLPQFVAGVLSVLLMGPCSTGCSCPMDGSSGVIFLVIGGAEDVLDDPGGMGGTNAAERSCRAVVEVSPSSKGTLTCTGSATGNNCRCEGGRKKGRYKITASLDGRTESRTVRVKKEDRCHLRTEYFCMFGDCPPGWP